MVADRIAPRRAETPRLFTVAEANACLPEVRQLLETIRETLASLEALAPKPNRRAELLTNRGGTLVPGPYFVRLLSFEEAVSSLQRMGCVLKDARRGLVDFPARIGGKEVLLCWQAGEERVGYWHDLETGFAGRRPLDED